MRKLIVLGAGAVLFAACAQHKQVTKVDDAGLARLNENQMEPVDEARIEEGRANDAVARARANEADARARYEVERSEKDVSDAQLKRALAERDLLKKQYASDDQMSRAEDDIRAAQDRIKATDLKLKYLQQLIALAEADRKVAEAHVATTHARTEQVKYQAMKDASAPQARAVNVGDLDRQLAQAQAREADLQQQAAGLRSNAVKLYNQWLQVDANARNVAPPQSVPVPPPVSTANK